MQAEVIILDDLGGFIADCTATVATTRCHLGVGGSGNDREA